MDRPDAPKPHLIRVQFSERLSHASRVPMDAPLSPLRRPAKSQTASPPPPPPAANLWETTVGRELAADRAIIERTLANLQAEIAGLRSRQQANLDGLQNAAVELSLTIASQLLHREVSNGEFNVESLVRDMANELMAPGPITVSLNPDDLQLLKNRLQGEPLLPGADAPRLVADPTLKRCECRVEGGDGALLISEPARQMQEIRDELLRNLGNVRND